MGTPRTKSAPTYQIMTPLSPACAAYTHFSLIDRGSSKLSVWPPAIRSRYGTCAPSSQREALVCVAREPRDLRVH